MTSPTSSRWTATRAPAPVRGYTALGHEVGMYEDPAYRQHLLGGLLTVIGHGRRRFHWG